MKKEEAFFEKNLLNLYIDDSGGGEHLPETITAYGWNLFDLDYNYSPVGHYHALVDGSVNIIADRYNKITENDNVISLINNLRHLAEAINYKFLFVHPFEKDGETIILEGETKNKYIELLNNFADAENKAKFFIDNCEHIYDKDLLDDLYKVANYKHEVVSKINMSKEDKDLIKDEIKELDEESNKLVEAYNNALVKVLVMH